MVRSDGSAPFFLESVAQPSVGAALRACGFRSIATYHSSRDTALRIPANPAFARHVQSTGVVVRQLDPRDTEADLGVIFELSRRAFAQNYLFAPIEREEFFAMYRPVIAAIDPRYVLLAFDPAGHPAAFVFAVPDRSPGVTEPTLIVKSYASVRPGLGRYVAHEVIRRAAADGFAAVIHALIHDDNVSAAASRRLGGTVFRRYALFGRAVGVGGSPA